MVDLLNSYSVSSQASIFHESGSSIGDIVSGSVSALESEGSLRDGALEQSSALIEKANITSQSVSELLLRNNSDIFLKLLENIRMHASTPEEMDRLVSHLKNVYSLPNNLLSNAETSVSTLTDLNQIGVNQYTVDLLGAEASDILNEFVIELTTRSIGLLC